MLDQTALSSASISPQESQSGSDLNESSFGATSEASRLQKSLQFVKQMAAIGVVALAYLAGQEKAEAADGSWQTNTVRNTLGPKPLGRTAFNTAGLPLQPKNSAVFCIESPYDGTLANFRVNEGSVGDLQNSGTHRPNGEVLDPYGADYSRFDNVFLVFSDDPRNGIGTPLQYTVPWGKYDLSLDENIFDVTLDYQSVTVIFSGDLGIPIHKGTNWIGLTWIDPLSSIGDISVMESTNQPNGVVPDLWQDPSSPTLFSTKGTLSMACDVISRAESTPPTLNIKNMPDGNIELNWNNAPGYKLMVNTSLSSSTGWVEVTNTPPVVRNKDGSASKFYILMKP